MGLIRNLAGSNMKIIFIYSFLFAGLFGKLSCFISFEDKSMLVYAISILKAIKINFS